MKVTVKQSDFSRAIEIAGRFTSKRSALPVLENVLLDAFGETLKVAATNLEMSIVYWIPCVTEDVGGVTLPGRLLGELVKQLPDGPVVLDLNSRTVTMSVRCGGSSTNIKGIAAEDFPVMPDDSLPGPVSFNGRLLGEAMGQVVFAAALDESRQALTGVYMGIDGKGMTMAATDGYRLAVRGIQHESEWAKKKRLEITVPRSAVTEVIRIAKGMDEGSEIKLSVAEDGNRAVFVMPDAVVACQLIDANYPNFRAIIPKRRSVEVVIDGRKLEKALRVVYQFSRDMHSAVKMDIDGEKNEVTVSAVSAEIGDGKAILDAEEVNGVEFTVMLNANYMADLLGALGSGNVVIEFEKNGSPVVFRPSQAVVGEWLYAIMPMHENQVR